MSKTLDFPKVEFRSRKAGSTWSASNKKRVAKLAKNGLMAPAGQAKIDAAKKVILLWIKTAKRDETRMKRVRETVRLAAKNVKAAYPEARGQ